MSLHLPPGVIHMSTPTIPDALMPEAWKDDDVYGYCCMGAAMRGAIYCTCWEEVYDLEQSEPVELVSQDQCVVRTSSCSDCAYRSDSPERSDGGYVEENLLALPDSGSVFWCHTGMRRLVAFVHPDGRRIDVPDKVEFHSYDPLRINNVPYKADGTPGEICGGWAARKGCA